MSGHTLSYLLPDLFLFMSTSSTKDLLLPLKTPPHFHQSTEEITVHRKRDGERHAIFVRSHANFVYPGEIESLKNKLNFFFGKTGFQTPGLLPLDSSQNSILFCSTHVYLWCMSAFRFIICPQRHFSFFHKVLNPFSWASSVSWHSFSSSARSFPRAIHLLMLLTNHFTLTTVLPSSLSSLSDRLVRYRWVVIQAHCLLVV